MKPHRAAFLAVRRCMPLFLMSLAFPGSSCRHLETTTLVTSPSIPQIRVSDRYSRNAVASSEAFKIRIEEHDLVMIHLRSGETFPMLCRVEEGGIYPIAQSVFSAGEMATKWSILCEPAIKESRALMSLNVTFEEGVLRVDRKALNRLPQQPRLLATLL